MSLSGFVCCADTISSQVGPSQLVALLDSKPGTIRMEDFGGENAQFLRLRPDCAA